VSLSEYKPHRSGFAAISDHQFLPGYCLLLSYPAVLSLKHDTSMSQKNTKTAPLILTQKSGGLENNMNTASKNTVILKSKSPKC